MKRFLGFYKSLSEDRVVTKEEDGGIAAPPGDVSAPPSAPSDSGDVVSTPSKDGGLSTDDVLGKCDHKKDGFFGPGCFHLPYAIFTVPLSRIKRKKKRKSRKLHEDEGFKNFKTSIDPIMSDLIQSINDDIVSKIDKNLKFEYNGDCDFSGDRADWVSAYEICPDGNPMRVGVNPHVLYEFLSQNDLEQDENELECQLKSCVYRELAHCLLRHFVSTGLFGFDLTELEEDEVADEYMKYKLGKYTGTTFSNL